MNRNTGNIILGVIVILLGLNFLFDFSLLNFLSRLWPLILIGFGLYFILNHRRKIETLPASSQGQARDQAVPGLAGDIKVSGLEDGIGIIEKKLLFGDIVMDLSRATLLEGENTIDASTLLGDITIIIREEFPVKVDLAAGMGNLDFKGKRLDGLLANIKNMDDNYNNAQAKLFIKVRLCFGDIKILVASK